MSCTSDESELDALLPPDEHVDAAAMETYMGEWKNDKRSGFGVRHVTLGMSVTKDVEIDLGTLGRPEVCGRVV